MLFQILGYHGQGIRSTTRILAKALSQAGMRSQWWCPEPVIKAQKVAAVVRAEKEGILAVGPADLAEADFLLVLHRSLLPPPKALKPGCTILLNSTQEPAAKAYKAAKIRLVSLDATGIALQVVGNSVPGAAMLGALVKLWPKLTLKLIKDAIAADLSTFERVTEVQASVDAGFRALK